jgi:hypothetical protein
MSAALAPAVGAAQPVAGAASAGVSNPVSFLVPKVSGADSGPVRSY